jgi:hypothetical protein
MSVKMYCMPGFNLTWPPLMNSVSGWLLWTSTCWCCAFIDLYLIRQGRVICDNDPIISMLTGGQVKLKPGIQYILTDMAVTSDNKLLLCDSSDKKVYIYNDPIISMLTFLISLNFMSISLIADDMSWIFLSVFWMIVICFLIDNKTNACS